MTTPADTRTHEPETWAERRAKGLRDDWAWQGHRPSLIDTLASLPQIASRRVADEIVRELAGRGLEIREVGR